MRNQSAQQLLEMLQQFLRRHSAGFTGNQIEVILTDNNPLFVDSKTVGSLRADTGMHMGAAPSRLLHFAAIVKQMSSMLGVWYQTASWTSQESYSRR